MSSARWDLCGGSRATGIPTATSTSATLEPRLRRPGSTDSNEGMGQETIPENLRGARSFSEVVDQRFPSTSRFRTRTRAGEGESAPARALAPPCPKRRSAPSTKRTPNSLPSASPRIRCRSRTACSRCTPLPRRGAHVQFAGPASVWDCPRRPEADQVAAAVRIVVASGGRAAMCTACRCVASTDATPGPAAGEGGKTASRTAAIASVESRPISGVATFLTAPFGALDDVASTSCRCAATTRPLAVSSRA